MHELTVTDEAAAVDLYAGNAVHEIPFAPAGAPARVEGREALRRLMDAQGRSPVKYQSFENVQVWETTDPEVIIGAVALLLAVRLLPRDPDREVDDRIDVTGPALLPPGLAALVYGLSQAGNDDPRLIAGTAAGLALLAAFTSRAIRMAGGNTRPSRLLPGACVAQPEDGDRGKRDGTVFVM
ncbi:hypothetical protein GCM10023191_035770 [Actinoallomurus oryzae]|uniref:Uncharacterized protein n=1 Tax=Actinoallomurus oryzae TaxID=502180 RepID=A0ABP8Q2D8_9ACTN